MMAEEGRRVEGAAQDAPAELPEGHVAHAERCREHGVVRLGDLELEEDQEGRVEHGPVHGRRGQQAWCDEGGVGHQMAVDVDRPDEVGQADADGEEVEERLEEARDDEDPRAPVHQDVALEHPRGVAPAEERERRDPQRDARRLPLGDCDRVRRARRHRLTPPTAWRRSAGRRRSRPRRTRRGRPRARGRPSPTWPSVRSRHSVDPVVERRDVGDDLEPRRQLRDREEGAREQEHRDDGEAIQRRERRVLVLGGGERARPARRTPCRSGPRPGSASSAHGE